MDYVVSFLIGGLDLRRGPDPAGPDEADARTGDGPARVRRRALLGFCGLYEPFKEFAKSGASVPLLGFGNTLWQGVKDAVDQNGFIGDLHGRLQGERGGDISAALIFGYLASFIFDPKMKK